MSDDEDVPVVLLHGVGLDRTVWTRLEARLAGPTSAIDLPGHGHRPALRAPTSLAELAADVVSRIPAGPVHLVGFSLGSLIAEHIAITSPARVRTLTCVSSVCARTPDEAAAVGQRLEGAASDFAGSMDRALDRWFPDGTGTGELRDETRRVLAANDRDSYRHAYAVFATGDRELEPELGSIEAPTLAITGQRDPGSTPEMSRRLAERIPDCRVVIVPEARHMLPMTHPEALAEHLTELFHTTEGSRR